MKLGPVLQSTAKVNVELEGFRSDELKQAARFWVAKEAGSYNKEKCIAALTQAMSGDDATQRVQAALSEKERQVLAIFTRYGPTVSGGVLTAEMYARGFVQSPPEDKASRSFYRSYCEQKKNDLIRRLSEKLVLVGNSYDLYYSNYYTDRYPQLSLHPALMKAVKPAAPLPWSASRVCPETVGTERRSSAEVALDLWRVASALRRMGAWATVKGESPSKATRARMRKEVGLRDAEKDPLSPPDPESLFYELLHGMGLLNFGDKPSWIHEQALERHLQQPPTTQAWQWVRAWLHMSLWQDGIGVVPDRDSDYVFVRIEPEKLYYARELLAWALSGVAHASDCWLDLETFLRDLWRASQKNAIDFYCARFAWNPEFEMARKREQYPAGKDRMLAFWLAGEAVWAANAIMVTLGTLGLVELGPTTGDKIRRFLTAHGKTELPANVNRMLAEWAGRRESLVLRTKVVLALGPAETRIRSRALNGNVFLLPSMTVKMAAKEFAGCTILDHEDKPERTWTTDELGSLTSNSGHSISQMRLARIADRTATGWKITQKSVARARLSGITADQILEWLGGHLTAEVPALLEVAVRNWTGRQGVKLSQAQLLRIVQPQAKEALLHSSTFRPFLAGHIPPEWFLIREDHLNEVRELLERLGFTIGDSLDPPLLGAVQNTAKDSLAATLRTSLIPKRPPRP